MGHMRSGSTLLVHLLSSHPEILGAGERNATYASCEDLRRLSVDVAYLRRKFFRGYGYVVDQINHNRFLVAEDLLNHPRVCKIFLIREPKATLASMVEVFGRHYGMTPRQAVDYYLDRLGALERYARQVREKGSSFFLTYDDLVIKSEPVLRHLGCFLRLRTPLAESYQVFDFTGKRGDPSRRISSGRILPRRPRRPIDLEPGLLQQASEAYARCASVLEERCETSRLTERRKAHR